MEPAYATYDPGLLYVNDAGLAMPLDPNTAQYTPLDFAIPSSVGDFITNTIRSVTAQLPGIIGGESGVASAPVPAAPSPVPPLVPLLLVGGLVYLLLRRG
ncbi:MAG: hypothetical protein L0214_07575 [candidate division NC10 bacterium]|nr:hypothetical protein [candidate division NC10 bacterium]